MPADRADTKQRQRKTSSKSQSAICEICLKSISRSGRDMERHMQTHNPVAPRHQCTFPGCQYAALQASNLKQHIIRAHSGEPKKPRSSKNCDSKTSVAPKRRKNIISTEIATPRGSAPANVQKILNESAHPEQAFAQFNAFTLPQYSPSDSSSSSQASSPTTDEIQTNSCYNSYSYIAFSPQDLTGKAQESEFQQQAPGRDFSWSLDIPDFIYWDAPTFFTTLTPTSPSPTLPSCKDLLDDVPQALPAHESTGGLEMPDFDDLSELPALGPLDDFPICPSQSVRLPFHHAAPKSQRSRHKALESAKNDAKRSQKRIVKRLPAPDHLAPIQRISQSEFSHPPQVESGLNPYGEVHQPQIYDLTPTLPDQQFFIDLTGYNTASAFIAEVCTGQGLGLYEKYFEFPNFVENFLSSQCAADALTPCHNVPLLLEEQAASAWGH